MKTEKINVRFGVLVLMVFAAALSRLIPHPPNFTPIAAMALFGGAYFVNKKTSFAVPLLAMLVSDIGLTITMGYDFFTTMRIVVYGCFVLITLIGFLLRSRVKVLNVVFASLSGSLLFFIITNFFVWAGGTHDIYPLNATGLIECYVAAIPFFRNMLFGDMLYAGVMFGAFELAKRRFPKIAIGS